MAAVLHFMNVVVCNECDAMHIAAAVGTPVVAVYCEGSPDLTKPAGSEFVAVKAQSISASSSGVDVVIESALRLLRDHPKLGRLEADEFDISDEVINEYLGILNTFDG
jgi:ADP-heptose:LPS heptosyltransferase